MAASRSRIHLPASKAACQSDLTADEISTRMIEEKYVTHGI
jgi:hypothetical protein